MIKYELRSDCGIMSWKCFLGIILGVGLTSGLTCPPQSDTGAGRHVVSGSLCYMFYQEPLSWAEAGDVCAQNGASLMVMRSEREHGVAVDFMNSDGVDVLWLGGERVATDWHWLDDTVLGDFNPWLVDPDADDELDNCAAIIHAALGGPTGWAQKRCATGLMYICQVDSENPDCNPGADRKVLIQDPVCFVTFEDKVSWFTARTECAKIGGNLASVVDNETQEALLDSVEGLRTNGFWFGLRKDKWVWKDGAEVVKTFWDSSNPASDGKCISMRAFTDTDFYWETAKCHWEAAYACQMDALDLSTSVPGDTSSFSTSVSESASMENVSSALATDDALTDVVTSPEPGKSSSTSPEISVSSTPFTTNGSSAGGVKTTTGPGTNDGGSGDSSKAALTGGLAVLAVLLIIILGTVIIFFCCYHRRGKVLRDKARRESVRLEEAAQRRKQQAAAAYYNAAFSEEHEAGPPPPRHNVGVRDQNENHSKPTPRTSVVDLFTASNCRTEAYVSNALKEGPSGKNSGEQSSDRRGRSREEPVSKDANFGTANSWKFDSEFSVAQSPKKERKQLGNQGDFNDAVPNEVEPVYEEIGQVVYENTGSAEIGSPPEKKSSPPVAKKSPKRKETTQQSQHAVAAAADDVTDPITSNLGDESLRVLNEYRDDIQQALDTTVEDDNTTLNSEAEENIPQSQNMFSSGDQKPDDDRLHFVLQDLTRQLQMAKEKKKDESRCNSARDDNAVGSARDSSRGKPTEDSIQTDQGSARDKPVSSRLGLLPPIQVATASGGKKKKEVSSNKQRKYSQDNGRQRRNSVGQNSDDSTAAPKVSQSRRGSVPSLDQDGGRKVKAKHRGGYDDESESERDDGESGFTIDDILTGPSFVNQQRNGEAQGSGVLQRGKLHRDSGSNEKQHKSRSRPRDSSRDKRRANERHSRDSSRDRTRRQEHSREKHHKGAKPRHKHDNKTRRESATALVDSRQSSVESDQDPELVIENTAPPKLRTVNPDSWATPSGGLQVPRGVAETQKMNSSGEGAQFGMGMLLESLDQSAAIEI